MLGELFVNKFYRIAVLCFVFAIVLAPAGVLLAEGANAGVDFVLDPETQALYTAQQKTSKVGFGYLGVCIGAGLAAAGGGVGIAVLGSAVISASARQPEMRGQLTTIMFIGAALVEGLALFAIVVCILCLFM